MAEKKAPKNRVAEHRERKGMTQAQLAALCDTTVQQICRVELGHRPLSGQWLTRLSEALAVPKGALLLDPGSDGDAPPVCDIVEDSLERMLLSFWRDLPNEGKRAVFAAVTEWANRRNNRPAARSA
jgi:transcriptional regulator with XRE-family HTH domain